ncbi:hypothetical protein ACQKMD_04075 [Viridibacillus sp. NPDC096237]|uniref:hypothetical protein n=1 Tax=Viridibacillus sp. NPDC096237 TaxID=3390721 RepID=UPI003D005468
MKKSVFLICLIIILGGTGYYGVSKYEEVKLKDEEKLREEVVDYLKNKGFNMDDYSSPKYVKDKSLKGSKSNSIEIIFNNEKKYTYYFIKENGKVKVFYARNNDTSEADYNKKEPRK